MTIVYPIDLLSFIYKIDWKFMEESNYKQYETAVKEYM